MATLERLVAYPPYRAVWKMARDGMGGDYRDYVDSLMDKVPSDTSRSLTDVFKIYMRRNYRPKACESATALSPLIMSDSQPLRSFNS